MSVMANNTEDVELRKQVAEIVEYWDFSPLQDEDSRIKRVHKEIESLIRTEKLKLLAEVRERVVGEKKDQEYRLVDTEYASTRKEKVYLSDGISRNKLRSEQRIELTKLEAEL